MFTFKTVIEILGAMKNTCSSLPLSALLVLVFVVEEAKQCKVKVILLFII